VHTFQEIHRHVPVAGIQAGQRTRMREVVLILRPWALRSPFRWSAGVVRCELVIWSVCVALAIVAKSDRYSSHSVTVNNPEGNCYKSVTTEQNSAGIFEHAYWEDDSWRRPRNRYEQVGHEVINCFVRHYTILSGTFFNLSIFSIDLSDTFSEYNCFKCL